MIAFRTVSGRRLDLEHLSPEDVTIGDVARGLSLSCRFGAQMHSHYSVAQHSVLVASMVDPPLRIRALLHDASEAYLGDVTYHLKHHPGMVFYRELECGVTNVIQDAFGLPDPTREEQQQIKHADSLAAIFEHVMLRDRIPWSADAAVAWAVTDGFSKGDPAGMLQYADRLPTKYQAWSSVEAEWNFLTAFSRGNV